MGGTVRTSNAGLRGAWDTYQGTGVTIGIVDACFLARCIVTHTWSWLRRGWVPVGLAWNRAIDTGIADDNPYDDTGASKMDLWAYDHYHASAFGYYLEALMDFGRVTGLDPMVLSGKDKVAEDIGISPAQSKALIQVAHDTLAASK